MGIRSAEVPFKCRELWKGKYVGRQLRRAGVKGEIAVYPESGLQFPAKVALNVDQRDTLL